MKTAERFRLLDGTAIKLIAMVSMVIDHVGDHFFPQAVWMRAVGRLALPLFAFCVSEGYIHTHDRKKYLLRMGAFALVSELPFDLLIAGRLEFTHQNVMVTFFLAICALMLYDRITGGDRSAVRNALGVAAVIAVGIVSLLLRTDYNFFALGLVFVFYVYRKYSPLVRIPAAAAFHALLRNVGIYWWGLAAFVLLLGYNGKKGRGLKWLFYVFYPGHMLLLYFIGRLI